MKEAISQNNMFQRLYGQNFFFFFYSKITSEEDLRDQLKISDDNSKIQRVHYTNCIVDYASFVKIEHQDLFNYYIFPVCA